MLVVNYHYRNTCVCVRAPGCVREREREKRERMMISRYDESAMRSKKKIFISV